MTRQLMMSLHAAHHHEQVGPAPSVGLAWLSTDADALFWIPGVPHALSDWLSDAFRSLRSGVADLYCTAALVQLLVVRVFASLD